MAYFSSVNELYQRYGTNNVQIWSDLDGTGVVNNARLALALNYGDAWVWGKLYRTEYQSVLGPLSSPTILDASGNVPPMLVMAATMFSAYYLLSARGFRDFDKDMKPLNRLYADLQMAENTMKDIQDKTLSLNVSGVDV